MVNQTGFSDELVRRSRNRHIGVQLPHQASASIQKHHSQGDVEVDELKETGTQPGVEDHKQIKFLIGSEAQYRTAGNGRIVETFDQQTHNNRP